MLKALSATKTSRMPTINDNEDGMYDVADKIDTLRTATAQAIIRINPQTLKLIRDGKTPKGNIFNTARVSATLAAKRTSDIIPYCHPIPIDDIKVNFVLNDDDLAIVIKVHVKTVWKTGVEMEALTGASVASLTIYDMLKPVDESLSIESLKLIDKQGGIKNLPRFSAPQKLTAAVLVASDSRGYNEDKSGRFILDKLKENGFEIAEYKVVADDAEKIESSLKKFCDELRVNLVVTTGGTGVGPRDVTPDVTRKVIQKELAGIGETIRSFGQRRVPSSMLSRGTSGVRERTLIINLPGSLKAVSQSLNSLFPGILHIFDMLEGKGH
ncbi:MAG TPA: bifunctional molybdenum cofactor biosynthesis protein MoaC/MoaB [Nitrososphaeraceae archaeon]